MKARSAVLGSLVITCMLSLPAHAKAVKHALSISSTQAKMILLEPVTKEFESEFEDSDGVITVGDDSENESGDHYYEDWKFTAKAGDRFEFVMSSTEIDAYLLVGTGIGEQFIKIKEDNDGAGDESVNAKVAFIASADGEYTVHATTYGADSTGKYVLKAPYLAPAARVIEF